MGIQKETDTSKWAELSKGLLEVPDSDLPVFFDFFNEYYQTKSNDVTVLTDGEGVTESVIEYIDNGKRYHNPFLPKDWQRK